MKDWDSITVSKAGHCTLPKWWREASGLSQGGVVEVRAVRDGKNSLILTPKPSKRRGAVGLLKQFGRCPDFITPSDRQPLPFK